MLINRKRQLVKRNRGPWKFAGPIQKILMPIEKVYKKSKKKKWKVIDIRLYEEYEKSHLANSIHVSFSSIRKFIEGQDKKTKIILITRSERSFQYLVPWAKANGHRIYILKGGFNKSVDSTLLQHKHKSKKQDS